MSKTIPIIIFIHGTLPPKALLHVPVIKRFYACPEGLVQLAELPDCHTKNLLVSLCKKHPDAYQEEHCHTFGWSGFFNHTARTEAALDLYRALGELKRSYVLKGLEPSIHLITHSHGGNVALSLKKVAEQSHNRENIIIDRLILLACPVQLQTADCIQTPLFKQVYSIHSHHDILQVLDPQGIHTFLEHLKHFGFEFTLSHLKELGPLFSGRHFPKNSVAKQLNVKYRHRELFHIEFLLPPFMESLPSLISTMDAQESFLDEIVHIFRPDTSQ